MSQLKLEIKDYIKSKENKLEYVQPIKRMPSFPIIKDDKIERSSFPMLGEVKNAENIIFFMQPFNIS